MGIDNLKLMSAIKFSAFAIYAIYFSIYNSSLIKYLPTDKGGFFEKESLINNKCLLLIGGSTVRQGLSAELLSTNSCQVSNLGFNAQMHSVDKYLNWLGNDIKVDNIIYSSGIFWFGNKNIEKSRLSTYFPIISLFTIGRYIIENPRSTYSLSGDLKKYNCGPVISSHNIDAENFLNSDKLVASEINQTILKLKNNFHSANIFFKVPPIYLKTEEEVEHYSELINKRIELIKDLGVKIVGKTIVSTDNSLFCDSFHPNAKGREEFTKEIKLP